MQFRPTLAWAFTVLATLAACELKRPTDAGSDPLMRVVVRPESVALDPQQTQPFQAFGITAAGDTVRATVRWSVSAGTITSSGMYTADASPDDATVTAALSGGQLTASGHVSKRRLVQIILAPPDASVPAGATQQFTAYGRRNTGDSVAVNVTYSATGGTITPSGLYTAGSTAGAFRVIAREPVTSLGDTSAVSVTSAPPPPPPPPPSDTPGTVSSLALAGVTDSSVTLSFTEVTDGTGQPANYEVRWAPAAISWGSATQVTRGSCTTPVVGSAVGATRTCTVLGLQSSTTYGFQLVAFRGTLNVDAVFGALSNVASGTTTGTGSAAPVDTLFAEDFESGTLSAWQDGVDPTRHRVVTDPSGAQAGSHYLDVTYPAGADGGWLTRFLLPGYDSLYVSYYVRFPTTWQGSTKLIAFYGSRTDNVWSAFGQAGKCPTGTDFFAAMLVTDLVGSPGPTRFYSYYPAMARQPDGVTCWGRFGDGTETYAPLAMSTGVWHHVEYWVKLNTPGQSDARQMFWIDGVQRGTWSGLSFRSSAILTLNSVQLTFSTGAAPQTQHLAVDHLVVTTGQPGR